MNFAVLIELSRKSIAFRYYRDDAGNMFMPFDENVGSMPLAIYCQGNDLQIGDYALSEAERYSQYAWKDIFDVIDQPGTFVYRGQEINMNELLLVAIKKYLSDFFDRILVKTKGTLEANISTMPLIFLFHPDIENRHRLFVKKSFRDGGFVNMAAVDINREIVGRLKREKRLPHGKKVALTVFSDGKDLIVNAIDIEKCEELKSLRIAGKGVDPRVKFAVDRLWDSLGIYSYNMLKENEYGILQQIATEFLGSDDIVFQRQVVFSDGEARDCYLDKNQIEGIEVSTDSKIKNDVLNLISQMGLQESDCVIAVCGSAAYSEFFIKNMQAIGTEMIVDKDPGLQKTLKYILDAIIEKQFKIGETSPAIEHPVAAPLLPPESTRVHQLLKKVAYMTPQNAQSELLRLEYRLKRINPQPADLQSYLDRIRDAMNSINSQPQASKIAKPQPTVPQKPTIQRPTTATTRHVVPPRNTATPHPTVPHRPTSPNVGTAQSQQSSKPLSPDEVRNANSIIFKARTEAPDDALSHLKTLLEHIEQLNPVNLKMWSNRLNVEIRNAQERLNRMPKRPAKPATPPRPAAHNKPTKPIEPARSSMTSKPKAAAKPKLNIFGAAASLVGNITHEAGDLAKAQKLFTDTFRDTFKLKKADAVKKLEELLKALHALGVHKFDFQINSRIELLKKQ